MDFLEKIKFASEIDKNNKDSLHDDIQKEARVLLERWTKDCERCDRTDWHIAGGKIDDGFFIMVYIICGYCGGAYLMLPAAVRHIEKDKEKVLTPDKQARAVEE